MNNIHQFTCRTSSSSMQQTLLKILTLFFVLLFLIHHAGAETLPPLANEGVAAIIKPAESGDAERPSSRSVLFAAEQDMRFQKQPDQVAALQAGLFR